MHMISDWYTCGRCQRGDGYERNPPLHDLKIRRCFLYNTTDLATLMMRRKEIDPDQVIYVVDKRQALYFEQVFRCARKTKIVRDDLDLVFLGFGTVNGKDGHAFKTREGGVMRLENLISQINEKMFEKDHGKS